MVSAALRNKRGIALLITLAIITILVTVTLELHRKARFNAVAAALNRDRVTLFYMASAAIHAGMALLVKDKKDSDVDSIQEDWAKPESLSRLLEGIPFERGRVDLKITDELGKIQVNALVSFPEGKDFDAGQKQVWLQFLEEFISPDSAAEDMRPEAIVNSIKDWLDSGDNEAVTGLEGAESDYYQGLEPPYPCKNHPLDDLGELALIKGVTPALLYNQETKTGILQHLTVYGLTDLGGNTFTFQGKININTADPAVIAAILPAGGEDLAQALVEYRQETTDLNNLHDLSNPQWYKQVPGLGNINIDPQLIRTDSDVFSLESTATLNTIKATVHAVIMRERDNKTGQWRCKILNWQQN